jgi:hypothetical protein
MDDQVILENTRNGLIMRLPVESTAFIEFTGCPDDSVVERAKFKENNSKKLFDFIGVF